MSVRTNKSSNSYMFYIMIRSDNLEKNVMTSRQVRNLHRIQNYKACEHCPFKACTIDIFSTPLYSMRCMSCITFQDANKICKIALVPLICIAMWKKWDITLKGPTISYNLGVQIIRGILCFNYSPTRSPLLLIHIYTSESSLLVRNIFVSDNLIHRH